MPGRYGVSMSAQPIREADPDDPAEILRVLPERWHAEFADEYQEALDTARDMRHWAELRALLHRYSSAKVEVVPDTTLNKGDVLFETAHGALDASVDAQLSEIERGLTDRLQK